MKNVAKALFLIMIVSFITISCNSKDDDNSPAIITDDVVVVEDPIFEFEAGNYDISWEGSPFKTTLTKVDENTLTGSFCLNNSINNCEDIGPITITRDENNITFKFNDTACRISEDLPGDFNGSGTITSNNVYSVSVSGEDCKRTYTNNRVIFTKI